MSNLATLSGFNNAPKFGFRSRPAGVKRDYELPGPGAYLDQYEGSYKHQKRGNYSLAKRLDISKGVSPGPGEYATHTRGCIGQNGPHPTAMRKSNFAARGCDQENPTRRKHRENPGPGAYNTEKLSTLAEGTVTTMAPQYRFGREGRKALHEVNPGPGAYKAMSTFGH